MMVAGKESIEQLTGHDLFKEFGYDGALKVSRAYEDGSINKDQFEDYTELFEQANFRLYCISRTSR